MEKLNYKNETRGQTTLSRYSQVKESSMKELRRHNFTTLTLFASVIPCSFLFCMLRLSCPFSLYLYEYFSVHIQSNLYTKSKDFTKYENSGTGSKTKELQSEKVFDDFQLLTYNLQVSFGILFMAQNVFCKEFLMYHFWHEHLDAHSLGPGTQESLCL